MIEAIFGHPVSVILVEDLENATIRQMGILVQNTSGDPRNFPQTLKDVDLPGRIRAAGGSSLKAAGEFFGWEPAKITKAAADFTKDQLLAHGWTKQRLLNVADGYEHIVRITPNNPSAAGRATQLRDIAKRFD